MTELIDTLIKYLWVCDFAALCVFFTLVLKNKQANSSLITLTIVMLISGIIIHYEALVNAIEGPESGPWMMTAWCIGFAVFDIIAAFVFYRSYQALKITDKVVAKVSFVVFSIVFMVSAVVSQFGPLLFDTAGPSYKVWVRVAFYLGTAFLDGVVIYAIYQVHQVFKIQYSLISRMYLLGFFVAANFQIMRFLERYTWDSHYLAAIYRWGLISMNVTTTTVVLVITCLTIYRRYSNKDLKGVLWNI